METELDGIAPSEPSMMIEESSSEMEEYGNQPVGVELPSDGHDASRSGSSDRQERDWRPSNEWWNVFDG